MFSLRRFVYLFVCLTVNKITGTENVVDRFSRNVDVVGYGPRTNRLDVGTDQCQGLDTGYFSNMER